MNAFPSQHSSAVTFRSISVGWAGRLSHISCCKSKPREAVLGLRALQGWSFLVRLLLSGLGQRPGFPLVCFLPDLPSVCIKPFVQRLLRAMLTPQSACHESRQAAQGDGKRGTWHPSLERAERSTLGITDLSASPLCLARSWNRSSTPRPSTACPCPSLQAAISTHWRKMPFLPCLLGNLTSLTFPGFSRLCVSALIAARILGISSHGEGLWISVSYFHVKQWFRCFNSTTDLTLLGPGGWWDGWLHILCLQWALSILFQRQEYWHMLVSPCAMEQWEGELSSSHLPLGESHRGRGQVSCESTAVSGVRVNWGKETCSSWGKYDCSHQGKGLEPTSSNNPALGKKQQAQSLARSLSRKQGLSSNGILKTPRHGSNFEVQGFLCQHYESRKPQTPMQYPQKYFFYANLSFWLKNSLKSEWRA